MNGGFYAGEPLPGRKVASLHGAFPGAPFFGLFSLGFFGVAHDVKMMIAIVLAGDAFDVRQKLRVGGRLTRFEIALRWRKTNGAFSEDTAMRWRYFATAGVVGHAPVMDRAEGSQRAGQFQVIHKVFLPLNDFVPMRIFRLRYLGTKDVDEDFGRVRAAVVIYYARAVN